MLALTITSPRMSRCSFLASKLVGLKLNEAPQPREIGHTLCGYTLQLAFEKIKELLCLP